MAEGKRHACAIHEGDNKRLICHCKSNRLRHDAKKFLVLVLVVKLCRCGKRHGRAWKSR